MGCDVAPGSPGDLRPVFSVDTQELLDEDIGQDLSAQGLKVQRRIHQLELEISALKNRQNILRCPLNRMLPPELLLRIFLLHPASNGKSKRVHLSHVCRQWRSIALESGAFWADLLFTTTEMTELMLNRSKEALLTARCDKLDRRHRDIIATILSQRGRLHTLEISGPRNMLPPFEPGPQTAPFLRSLSLKKISIPVWKSLPLGPSITELRLDSPTVENRVTMEELFGSLSEMPLLSTLHLSHLLPKAAPSHTDWTKQPFSLANLRELRLQDLLTQVCHFLTSVHISHFATVFVDFNDTDTTPESLNTFLDTLGVSWSFDEDEPCRWDDENSQVQELTIENFSQSFHRPSIALSFTADTVPDLTLSFPKHNRNYIEATTFLAVLDKKLNLAQTLISTNLNSCDQLTHAFWDQLGSSDNLKTVTFTKSPVYEVFFSNSVIVIDGSDDISPEDYFISLSTITVMECDLGRNATSDDVLAIIGEYLAIRADESDLDLTLEITECRNFDEEGFNEIKGPYPRTKVVWDYFEDMSEDGSDSE